MEWWDQAIVLRHRRHGEHDAIVTTLTQEHGRHLGLVKGGFGSKRRASIEPGQEVRLHWHARLSEQLGRFDLETQRNLSAAYMDDAKRLAAVLSAFALLDVALPERENHSDLFFDLRNLLEHLSLDNWRVLYVRWEARLLASLGYGLNLESCAVTGETENLVYVSPRSGRAVSRDGAGPYRDRLLLLPSFLLNDDSGETSEDIKNGLRLTGHFLERHVLIHQNMPEERRHLERII